MKNTIRYLALAIVSLLPTLAWAADVSMSGTSLFRFEQSAFPGFTKQTIVPATQFFGVDVDKIGDGNLSLHLYGWGRVDLADKSTNEQNDTDGNFTYGYLLYRFPTANAEIKAGRFFINEGVAAEQIDGISARANLKKGFALTVFGGAPVKLDRDRHSKGDYIAGGRLGYRLAGILELGVSGLHEGNVTLDPASGAKDDRQLVGGDIWFSPLRMVELNGHSFYNAATDGISEHSYSLSLKPLKTVTLSGVYNEQHFKNYFTYSNLRSLFNPDTDGELKSYGGGVTWALLAPLEVGADYRRYNRTSSINNSFNTDNNGNSNRYGMDLRLILLDRKVRSGISYHRSEGASGFNSYHEVRSFGMYDSGRYVASLDGIVQLYKYNIFNRHQAYELIGSSGYRLFPELLLSGDISYTRNPRLNDELRGVLRLTFNYAVANKGAKK
ncbi:MAG: hypothetical protein JJE30_12770 [Desulfuromonadales bacterium]|nr:hypothetical protein [Desulfuromonadales bacterium]